MIPARYRRCWSVEVNRVSAHMVGGPLHALCLPVLVSTVGTGRRAPFPSTARRRTTSTRALSSPPRVARIAPRQPSTQELRRLTSSGPDRLEHDGSGRLDERSARVSVRAGIPCVLANPWGSSLPSTPLELRVGQRVVRDPRSRTTSGTRTLVLAPRGARRAVLGVRSRSCTDRRRRCLRST